jgi:hypothetical protein
MAQVVSFTLFRLKKGEKLWAFGQMASLPPHLAMAEGCSFSKMMGSGNGVGFSIWPNFGVYAMMMVWDDIASFRYFEAKDLLYHDYKSRCTETLTLIGQAYKYHGTWDGKTPFESIGDTSQDQRRMVLTRATIRLSKLISFWRYVPATSAAIEQAEGRLFSIGIGEWPFIQQATLSVWKDEDMIKQYAYKNQAHLQAIKMTKELDWYTEEMFTRFVPLYIEGTWSDIQLV